MKHSALIAEFLATPWAMMPERMSAFAAVLSRHVRGERLAMEDDDGRPPFNSFEARKASAQARAGNGAIAVIPLYGAIVQRANMMTDFCGGTSTQQFTQAFRDAMSDETVGSILIDIDSPGGSVYGVGELANEIYQARGSKNIVAVSNSLAASAAYWVGSAANEFYVTPGGEVGSIGVWMAHEDWSKAMDEAGVKMTLISAGKYKTEGNPYTPLDTDAQAFMQSRVDDYYAAFTKGVSKGRNVGIAQVRDGMGQGRVLGADEALAQNMVDGIASFDDVIKNMQRQGRATKTASRLAQAENELKLIA